MDDQNTPPFGGSVTDLNSTLQGLNKNVSQLITVIQQIFPRINGSFTLSNATTTIVTEPSISANSIVSWQPTNATAALTIRTAGLYKSAQTAGTGFSLSTQNGSAIGTETFSYFVVTPS
jgi:hypothetical protein